MTPFNYLHTQFVPPSVVSAPVADSSLDDLVMNIQPYGFEVAKVFNRTGATAVLGGLVAFDITASATETSNDTMDEAGEDSVWRNVVTPGAVALSRGLLAIWLNTPADDAEGWVMTRGVCRALVHDVGGGNVNRGEGLIADLDGSDGILEKDSASAPNQAYVAICGETVAAATPALADVYFNGLNMSQYNGPAQT